MPVRNIQDKAVRISLSKVDQTDARALLEVAAQARDKELLEDARRIIQFILEIEPEHSEAQGLLSELATP
jgi:hypothetical protein